MAMYKPSNRFNNFPSSTKQGGDYRIIQDKIDVSCCLYVQVLFASDLRGDDTPTVIGQPPHSDPYVTVSIGNDDGELQRYTTPTVNHDLHPVFTDAQLFKFDASGEYVMPFSELEDGVDGSHLLLIRLETPDGEPLFNTRAEQSRLTVLLIYLSEQYLLQNKIDFAELEADTNRIAKKILEERQQYLAEVAVQRQRQLAAIQQRKMGHHQQRSSGSDQTFQQQVMGGSGTNEHYGSKSPRGVVINGDTVALNGSGANSSGSTSTSSNGGTVGFAVRYGGGDDYDEAAASSSSTRTTSNISVSNLLTTVTPAGTGLTQKT